MDRRMSNSLAVVLCLGMACSALRAQQASRAVFSSGSHYGPSYWLQQASRKTSCVALADFNGDGLLDGILGNERVQHDQMNGIWFVAHYTILNDGSGLANNANSNVFQAIFDNGPLIGFGSADVSLSTIVVHDMDGDGYPDIVLPTHGSLGGSGGRVLLNDGTGAKFSYSSHFSQGGFAITDCAAGDLNGDGVPDIVQCSAGSIYNIASKNYAKISNSHGYGGFSHGEFIGPAGGYAYGICLGDVDGDGDLDAGVAEGGNAPGQNYVCLNDGVGRFPVMRPIGTGLDASTSCCFADMNGDGYRDFVVSNRSIATTSVPHAIYLNDGAGNFDSAPLLFGSDDANHLSVADIDGDGMLDAAVGSLDDSVESTVYLNNGAGSLSTEVSLPGTGVTTGTATGDLDNSGTQDVVLANGLGFAWAYLNQGLVIVPGSPQPWYSLRETIPFGSVAQARNGVQPYVWSISGHPAWLSIDSASGQIAGTPPLGSGGSLWDVTISVTDDNGAGLTKSTAVRLDVAALLLGPLSYMNDFESATMGALVYIPASNARARVIPAVAATGTYGLVLDAMPGNQNWPLMVTTGEGVADDPARWAAEAGTHVGALEWSAVAGGVGAVDVSFAYRIENQASQAWYTNLVFEWSDDLGVTWRVAAGNGANTNGIYRDDTGGAFVTTGISVQGINLAHTRLDFRLRWLVKYADADVFPTCVYVDNLSIRAGATTPPVPLVITTASLRNGKEGVVYSPVHLAATGGTGAYTWSIDPATPLPGGLSLTGDSIAGTPEAGTAAASPYSITVVVADSASPAQSDSVVLTLSIVQAGTASDTPADAAAQASGGCALSGARNALGLLVLVMLAVFAAAARRHPSL